MPVGCGAESCCIRGLFCSSILQHYELSLQDTVGEGLTREAFCKVCRAVMDRQRLCLEAFGVCFLVANTSPPQFIHCTVNESGCFDLKRESYL